MSTITTQTQQTTDAGSIQLDLDSILNDARATDKTLSTCNLFTANPPLPMTRYVLKNVISKFVGDIRHSSYTRFNFNLNSDSTNIQSLSHLVARPQNPPEVRSATYYLNCLNNQARDVIHDHVCESTEKASKARRDSVVDEFRKQQKNNAMLINSLFKNIETKSSDYLSFYNNIQFSFNNEVPTKVDLTLIDLVLKTGRLSKNEFSNTITNIVKQNSEDPAQILLWDLITKKASLNTYDKPSMITPINVFGAQFFDFVINSFEHSVVTSPEDREKLVSMFVKGFYPDKMGNVTSDTIYINEVSYWAQLFVFFRSAQYNDAMKLAMKGNENISKHLINAFSNMSRGQPVSEIDRNKLATAAANAPAGSFELVVLSALSGSRKERLPEALIQSLDNNLWYSMCHVFNGNPSYKWENYVRDIISSIENIDSIYTKAVMLFTADLYKEIIAILSLKISTLSDSILATIVMSMHSCFDIKLCSHPTKSLFCDDTISLHYLVKTGFEICKYTLRVLVVLEENITVCSIFAHIFSTLSLEHIRYFVSDPNSPFYSVILKEENKAKVLSHAIDELNRSHIYDRAAYLSAAICRLYAKSGPSNIVKANEASNQACDSLIRHLLSHYRCASPDFDYSSYINFANEIRNSFDGLSPSTEKSKSLNTCIALYQGAKKYAIDTTRAVNYLKEFVKDKCSSPSMKSESYADITEFLLRTVYESLEY